MYKDISRQRRAQRESQIRRRELRRQWVDEFRNLPCGDCGGIFPIVCMDFDHVTGKKIANVSSLVVSRASREKILEEIAKCEVVCANCHRIRTEQRRLA